MASEGTLRRPQASIYTSNLDAPLDAIALRHCQHIVGHLLSGEVISHRSAFDGRPHEGALSIARGKTRRILNLPDPTIQVFPEP
jgi:hypothetical protein